MTKNVVISIVGTQQMDGEESQSIELMTEGTMTSTETGCQLTYEETDLTGMEGVTTTFELAPEKITLRREGALSSTMIFEEGVRHDSLYDMGFGALLIGVCARRIHQNMNERGGSFSIRYAVDLEGQAAGVNSYEISVREAAQA